MFKTGSTFLAVFKICKKRCIKFTKFTNFTQIKHELFAEIAVNKLFSMKQCIIIYKLQASFIRLKSRFFWHECIVLPSGGTIALKKLFVHDF